MIDIAKTILTPKRTKIKYRIGGQGVRTGYAWLNDNPYIWVFDTPEDICGFTIQRANLIEICE